MGYVFNPFIGNFDNAGSGSSTGGVEITHVEYYANLPTASSHNGEYYFVDKDTIWNKLNPLAKTQGGLYRSDGITWLGGLIPELAGVSDGTNVLVDYPVVFSGVTVDNTAKTVTINSQTDNNLTNALKSTYDGYATTKLDKNTAITGATKTKITYDTNGLITAGTDATTADIADSTNKRYVTDANLTVIGNTSGTNTGDETASAIKTKLETLTGANRLNASAINKEYASFGLSVSQTTDLAAGNLVKLDIYAGNLTLSNYKFTLKANKTYILSAFLRGTFVDDTGFLTYSFYDYTNNVLLKPSSDFSDLVGLTAPPSATSNNGVGLPLLFLFTPVSSISVGLQIYASANVTEIRYANSYLTVWEV